VELCELYGYLAEEHVVQTKDGYLLGVHRLAWRRGEEEVPVNCGPDSTQKKVVYLHHGLMMNSEVWVCITEKERCLPFLLVDRGYDVWLGNNRGNKYSKKSIHHGPTDPLFWNFSMDQFAFHDIPDSINYILDTTQQPSLSYIGFSQGTAQAFATLSIHPTLNTKVDVFVALAPAMAPPGLASGIVSSLVKSNPEVLFLLFGRRAILGSTTMWQALLYPAIFQWVIDKSMRFLFGWTGDNITPHQKLAAYPHLFSFTSTKSVVHWFQIIRNGKFQMFDDEVTSPTSFSTGSKYYKPAKFPTKNIKTPIVLIYGGSDSLVDIKLMMKELPKHTVAQCIPKYEHLDLLWASDVDTLVFPYVLGALETHSHGSEPKPKAIGWQGTSGRSIFDSVAATNNGNLPLGHPGNGRTHGRSMSELAEFAYDRPSTAEENLDESDEEDDDLTHSQVLSRWRTSSFGHSSHPSVAASGGNLPNHKSAVAVRSAQSSTPTQATLTSHTPRSREESPSPFATVTPPTWRLQQDAEQQPRETVRPNEGAGALRRSPPDSPLAATSLATDHTVIRSRPEGWWSSTNTSMTSLVDSEMPPPVQRNNRQ
jgi:lysosomal acid lipase/cholesteryl ester hydrolase